MTHAVWGEVVTIDLSKMTEATCIRVHLLYATPQLHTTAWGAFTLTCGDTIDIYVFDESDEAADSASRSDRAAAACLEACDS